MLHARVGRCAEQTLEAIEALVVDRLKKVVNEGEQWVVDGRDLPYFDVR